MIPEQRALSHYMTALFFANSSSAISRAYQCRRGGVVGGISVEEVGDLPKVMTHSLGGLWDDSYQKSTGCASEYSGKRIDFPAEGTRYPWDAR